MTDAILHDQELAGGHYPVTTQRSLSAIDLPAEATPEVLAYCAGIIDADGTIGIRRSTYGARVVGDCRQASYSERVALKQVEPHAVALLTRLFGGYRTIDDPSAKRGKPLHKWEATDRKAAIALMATLPYLRIKREQALNALALRDLKNLSALHRVAVGRGHVGAAPRRADITEAMERLKIRAGELNRAGIP